MGNRSKVTRLSSSSAGSNGDDGMAGSGLLGLRTK